MAVGTSESISVAPPEIKLPQTKFPRVVEHANPFRDRIIPEYRDPNVVILKPLPHVIEFERADPEEVDRGMDDQFEYLSRTAGLEINTPKTQKIQDIVDSLKAPGETFQTRVVVMQKAEEPSAFVFHDGTIFVSQSLLNVLDTEDEIASVLAHEIGHLALETSKMVINHSHASPNAIGRLHEMTADHKEAPPRMERAGYNTLAFGTAIEKVSGAEGGIIHQGGLARGSENVGLHFLRDFKTSNKEQILKPAVLVGRASKSNWEITQSVIKAYNDNKANRVLTEDEMKLLHPKDLYKLWKEAFNEYKSDYGTHQKKRKEKATTERDRRIIRMGNVITERMTSSGYSANDALIFMALNWNEGYSSVVDFNFIKSPEQFVDVIKSLPPFEEAKDRFANLKEDIFNTVDSHDSAAVVLNYLRFASVHIFATESPPDYKDGNSYIFKGTVPVDENAIIETVNSIHSSFETKFDKDVSNFVLNYTEKRFRKALKDNPQQAEIELRQFFERFKEGANFVPKGDLNTDEGKQIAKIRDEVFGLSKEKPAVLTFEEIDQRFSQIAFVDHNRRFDQLKQPTGDVIEIYKELRKSFDANSVPHSERFKYFRHLNQKIENMEMDLAYSSSLADIIAREGGSRLVKEPKDIVENEKLMKYQLKLLAALSIYDADSSYFYSSVNNVFSSSSILNNLPQREFITLVEPLIRTVKRENDYGEQRSVNVYLPSQSYPEYFSIPRMEINDFESFGNTYPVKKLAEKPSQPRFQSLADFNKQLSELGEDGYSSFGDSIPDLLYGQETRLNLIGLLEQGVNESEFGHLARIITKVYPSGPERDQFLRELDKRYIQSPQVDIGDKFTYVTTNFERMGPEGLYLVAEQIDDIEAYMVFRETIEGKFEQSLTGSSTVEKAAIADFLSAQLSFGFKELLSSASENVENSKEISTKNAKRWLSANTSWEGERAGIHFDKERGKFVLTNAGRSAFRTYAETVQTFKGLSEWQRLAVAHKGLMEQYGAFANPENRKFLGQSLVDSLDLKQEFVAAVLKTAAETGDAKYIGFPAAKMLAPLLFRGLDINNINLEEVLTQTAYYNYETHESIKFSQLPPKGIEGIRQGLYDRTRDVTQFGAVYRDHPTSLPYRLAQESNAQFERFTAQLRDALGTNKPEAQIGPDSEPKISMAAESIISGVESSGAVGVRALQLASQLYPFPENIRSRISNSFDKNPGLNKFHFWDNLAKFAQDDPEIEDYVRRLTVKDQIGAGSLNTTFAAEIRDDATQTTRSVVVKMLNPNAAAFIKQTHQLATNVLEKVQKQNGKLARNTNMGLLVVDLAQKWCIADIEDQTFLEDDANFTKTIDSFNSAHPDQQVFAPSTVFNSYKLKLEELAPGKTLNAMLKDNETSPELKKQAVDTVAKFFAYQMSVPQTEEGKPVYLLHSDPHVGNYVIEQHDEGLKIGVIDRNMYLKLDKQDVDVLKVLIQGGDYEVFVKTFLNRIFEINKSNPIERATVLASMLSVKKEYQRQKVAGDVDQFTLLRSIFGKLTSRNMDIPLNLQLMIRNVEALRRLTEQQGLDFSSYFK